jgi:SAM-dependent methyltransferase
MTALASQAELEEAQLTFPRAKHRDLLASVLHRAAWFAFRRIGVRALAVELRLSRIIGRLAFEHAGALYGDDFHNATLALPAAPLAEWVPAGSRVLDIGCGTGRVARLIAPHADAVLGLDRNPRAISVARQRTRHAGVTYAIADATGELPTGFDVTVLSHVIEHIEPVDAFLAGLHDVTGRLLVEVPQFGMDALNVVRRQHGIDFSSDADHVREYTREVLDAQLRRNGWQPVAWVERPISIAALAIPAAPAPPVMPAPPIAPATPVASAG